LERTTAVIGKNHRGDLNKSPHLSLSSKTFSIADVSTTKPARENFIIINQNNLNFMAVRYCVVPRKNPMDLEAPEKYYLRAKSVGKIDRAYLIKDMLRYTSLTQEEASSAINYLFEAVPRFVQLGFNVKLGLLGSFRATISSKGSDTIEEATVDKVKRIRIRFVCGKELREQIVKSSLEKFPE